MNQFYKIRRISFLFLLCLAISASLLSIGKAAATDPPTVCNVPLNLPAKNPCPGYLQAGLQVTEYGILGTDHDRLFVWWQPNPDGGPDQMCALIQHDVLFLSGPVTMQGDTGPYVVWEYPYDKPCPVQLALLTVPPDDECLKDGKIVCLDLTSDNNYLSHVQGRYRYLKTKTIPPRNHM